MVENNGATKPEKVDLSSSGVRISQPFRGLIEDFRKARTSEEKTQAAQNIVNNKKDIPEEYNHFTKVAEYMLQDKTAYRHEREEVLPVKPREKNGVMPDRIKTAEEVDQFMCNLQAGKTKSLISDVIVTLPVINEVNKIIINAVKKDPNSGAYTRSLNGVNDSIHIANGSGKSPDGKWNTEQGAVKDKTQLEALSKIIAEKYPLTIHLITSDEVSKWQDHSTLLKYGSYYMEKDPQFANRWVEHQQLHEDFKNKFNTFVKDGMKNTSDFEKEMQEVSKKVADIFKKDVEIMEIPGGITKKNEAIGRIEEYEKALKTGTLHLEKALTAARTQDPQKENQASSKEAAATSWVARVASNNASRSQGTQIGGGRSV